MQCPGCSYNNPAGARFCQNCGRPLEQFCSQCGTANAPAARFCKQCGTALAAGAGDKLSVIRQSAPQPLQEKIRLASPDVEGERKPVTILFTDIVGSTALAEKLDPEEWKEIVSGAHRRVSEAVYRYEGTIAQLLGDGVLAFFGAPLTHEDDPVRAVRAALDIQGSISAYAQKLHGYVDDFQMRIGINTGLVVIGNVGSDMHMEYLAIGDAVNLAARLQSAARPGGVLISESTEKLVKAAFELEPLGEITVKGKSETVRVFEAVDFHAAPGSKRGTLDLGSPFVGRGQELALLNAALEQVAAGHGGIVAVLGEAGIGKSRLVQEARNCSGASLRWLEGRALSYGEMLSFWTITQLILNDLGVSDGDPEPKIKAALHRRVCALFGERAGGLLPYLAHLMGVTLDDALAQSVWQLDGETLKRQTLWAITEYFKSLAQEQPLVLVFEDLHWADPSTLEALEKLLALTDRAPLLILLPSRVERDHGSWQIKVKAETNFAHRYTEIVLSPLSAEESNNLVSSLLEVADLPGPTRQLILERSEGNPFYLEEIIRSLIEQGVLLQEGDAWRAAADIGKFEIPETLQGVLLARIDRLQEDVRRTLQLASVIGRSFLYRLLEAIAAAERKIDDDLSLLQRADLVREKNRWPELEYIFKHSLTQEAAYNSILIERRREFHRRVGEALERLFAGREAEFYGLLAHHFDAAGAQDKAIEYLIKAGDKSRMEDAHEEAIQFYERAIALLEQAGDRPRLIKTWLKLGLIYQVNFRFKQAHDANEKAFVLERQIGPRQPRSHLGPPLTEYPRVYRLCTTSPKLTTLDPSKTTLDPEAWISSHLFAGLARFDEETNLVPHAARSWEVLDGGTRYIFHLRDDMRWTDGSPLTAQDFEATWKHNLAPDSGTSYAYMLEDVVGAHDYREGHNPDPNSVGVHALDPFTLEVRLTAPVAHFIYLAAQNYASALPLKAMQAYGDNWWKPGHIVSSGSFRLVECDEQHITLARNPDYFGEFPGNLDQFTWIFAKDPDDAREKYLHGNIDHLSGFRGKYSPSEPIPEELGQTGEYRQHVILMVLGLFLIPTHPPMDDPRIRRAIAHAVDRRAWMNLTFGQVSSTIYGGLVPPGMAGHSPELGLRFDLERARQLLSEAGYPGGRGLPALKLWQPSFSQIIEQFMEECRHQFTESLGIQLESQVLPNPTRWAATSAHLGMLGWMADYPDPYNFLHDAGLCHTLKAHGWHNPHLEHLLHEAAHTIDRARRLAMYREVDRILVNEEVVFIPLYYAAPKYSRIYVRPWVKGMKVNALGHHSLTNIVIEPH